MTTETEQKPKWKRTILNAGSRFTIFSITDDGISFDFSAAINLQCNSNRLLLTTSWALWSDFTAIAYTLP